MKHKIVLWIVLTGLAFGSALTVKMISWNVDNVLICRPTVAPNIVECLDLTYEELRDRLFADWLKNDPNSPADLWPDGKIDMLDFAELSRRWRN